jgi:rubrerythrin
MHFSAAFIALAAPFLVAAAPMKRAASATDLLVLQFAHVLEQLETQFYSQALAKFQESDFVAAGFSNAQIPIQQFTDISNDESTHVSVLESTITSQGGQVITSCQFNFDSVLTSVQVMAPVARIVEQVGVSAYLGAANLIQDPQLLQAAASIMTVEARHQTMLNLLNGGTSISQAFDMGLSPSEVLAIAGPFISGCDLGVPANPTLTVTNSGPINVGTSLQFQSDALNGVDPTTLSCQMMIGGAPFAISLPYQQCVVPSGINGVVYIYVTNTTQPLQPSLLTQFQGSIVAGPTAAFIDTQPDMVAQLLTSGGNRGTVSSTQTITPAEATQVASGASSSSTGSASPPSSGSSSSTDSSANGQLGMGPGPDFTTGPSADQNTIVIGWSNLPAGVSPPPPTSS